MVIVWFLSHFKVRVGQKKKLVLLLTFLSASLLKWWLCPWAIDMVNFRLFSSASVKTIFFFDRFLRCAVVFSFAVTRFWTDYSENLICCRGRLDSVSWIWAVRDSPDQTHSLMTFNMCGAAEEFPEIFILNKVWKRLRCCPSFAKSWIRVIDQN